MSLLALFSSAFLVGLTGAMMPGPMLSVTLERTAKLGWLAGPMVVIGHGILELLVITGLGFGLAQIISARLFTAVVGLLGGALLVWMGVNIVRDAGRVVLPERRKVGPASSSSTTWFSAVGAGITTSLSNPYWHLWWGTIGAGYVTFALQSQGALGLSTFFIGHILSDFAWFTAVAVIMATGGRFLPKPVYAGILRVLGLFLIVMALYFMISGLNLLFQ